MCWAGEEVVRIAGLKRARGRSWTESVVQILVVVAITVVTFVILFVFRRQRLNTGILTSNLQD